tara:strand:+ start:138 stop:806 length:669 start_codon:yes stop_codon:yes gene_type:complete
MALGRGLSFNEFNPRHSARMQGGAGAAENASVAENFSALRGAAPDYGSMGRNAIAAAGLEERAVRDANTAVRRSKIQNEASIYSAEQIAKAKTEAAQSQANSSMMGSVVKAGVGLLGAAFMSDETTKNTIEKIDDALGQLRNLKPVTFYYNEEYSSSPERLHHGFIAQEYQHVMPDATYFDESTGKLCIDTIELIALLVRGIQQLETRVTRMEAKQALAGVK